MSNEPGAAPHASPERIMGLIDGFQRSAILKGAIDLSVFTEIARGTDTVPALAARCQADAHGIEMLCNSLTVIGLLEKTGDTYRLAPDAAIFLDKASPAYLGGITSFLVGPGMLQAWSDVAAIVRRGGPEGLANISPENPIWVDFAKGMGAFMAPNARVMAKIIADGGMPKSVLDVAAGHGLFGIAVAKAAPDCHVTAQDWPNVLAVAEQNASTMGVGHRWTALPGSAFDVPFGQGYDVVLLTNFLHHFDVDTCEALLRKTYDSLVPGGRVVTLEFIPNDDGVSPPVPAMFGMVMLVSTPKGRAYRYSELEAMHSAAGFIDCQMIELPPTPQRLVIARKP